MSPARATPPYKDIQRHAISLASMLSGFICFVLHYFGGTSFKIAFKDANGTIRIKFFLAMNNRGDKQHHTYDNTLTREENASWIAVKQSLRSALEVSSSFSPQLMSIAVKSFPLISYGNR